MYMYFIQSSDVVTYSLLQIDPCFEHIPCESYTLSNNIDYIIPNIYPTIEKGIYSFKFVFFKFNSTIVKGLILK